ncbi:cell wall hydrolase [Natronincola ferrireducens]|uniref:N-acetylmuramoyl-L-alanine amidase n=1 Tax=Natronincola ferrireducens TaxID=393762 RepID=A0A1G8ZYC5_9FIRM|nr:cell wall hydrolase [Natronincola ferrireducens]SDK20139.1 N-acetylmuramoyl-L-alanine amidase [Natronincola ferrireducens]
MKIPSKKIIIGILAATLLIGAVASGLLANPAILKMEDAIMGTEGYLGGEDNLAYETSEEDLEEVEDREDVIDDFKDEVVKEIKEIKEKTTTEVKQQNTVDKSPITGERYTVKSGDTLSLIAQRAGVSLGQLRSINGLNSDTIYIGQVLKTKGTSPTTNVAAATNTQSPSRGGSQRDEDIYWLSRIIHAEAQGEPYQGKVAVGNVILNRVRSGKFPNTIYGVIFDRQDGYTQFSPVIDGTIYNTPHKDSVKAATEVLNGVRPVGEALYFLNPRKATNFWIVNNRQYMKTIGDHDFYY